MDDATDDLRARWAALGLDAGTGEDLLRRYAEEDRWYHNVIHLRTVLDMVDVLAGHAADPEAVRLAAWFHDAVYDPLRHDNERASADLAIAHLHGHPARAEVARLVLLTATHDPVPGDTNGAVLCDADLVILAASPEGYARYAADVRLEYRDISEPAFRAGRARILTDLLAHRYIFHTPEARARFEADARANLRTELELLGTDTRG